MDQRRRDAHRGCGGAGTDAGPHGRPRRPWRRSACCCWSASIRSGGSSIRSPDSRTARRAWRAASSRRAWTCAPATSCRPSATRSTRWPATCSGSSSSCTRSAWGRSRRWRGPSTPSHRGQPAIRRGSPTSPLAVARAMHFDARGPGAHPPRRAAARHRQDRHLGRHPRQSRAADGRADGDCAGAPSARRANPRSAAALRRHPADGAAAPRAVRRRRLPRRPGRDGHRARRPRPRRRRRLRRHDQRSAVSPRAAAARRRRPHLGRRRHAVRSRRGRGVRRRVPGSPHPGQRAGNTSLGKSA